MTSFWRIFSLEWKTLLRSRTLLLLVLASFAWIAALPFVLKNDGTADGSAELFVRYALGGVLALTVVALVAAATGSISRERTAGRLQLTLVRPVTRFSVVYARFLALLAAAAVTIGLTSPFVLLRISPSRGCYHVVKPVLESPREEAERMYEVFMNDPNTSDEVRKAPKPVVIRLLTQRAFDHYQTILTNTCASWTFDPVRFAGADIDDLAVRIRFTNQFNVRQDVRGVFRFEDGVALVTNITQAVLTVPFVRSGSVVTNAVGSLVFENHGVGALMLRPRRDLDLLSPGDSFVANLFRAELEMLSVVAVLIAFSLFLGVSLGRACAAFTAFAVLLVMLMSPSVVEQYPDQLEKNRIDRIGLWIVRSAESVTRPVSSLAPLEALARDEAVEWDEALSSFLSLAVISPLVLSLLAAFVLPRKTQG